MRYLRPSTRHTLPWNDTAHKCKRSPSSFNEGCPTALAEKPRTDAQALYALVYHRLCIELGILPRKPGKLCHHCRGESIRGGLLDVRAQLSAILRIQMVNASGMSKACDSREGGVQDVSEADSSRRGIAANTGLLPSSWRKRGQQSDRRGSETHHC